MEIDRTQHPEGALPQASATPTVLGRIDGWMQKFEEWAILITMGTLIVGTFLQVVLRNLPGNPSLPWIDIMVRLLVLWVGLLGASLAVARHKHVNVDILSRFFPESVRQVITAVAALLSLTVLLVIVHGAFMFHEATAQSTTPLAEFEDLGFSISETLFTAVLPFLFMLMMWHTWADWKLTAVGHKFSNLFASVFGLVFLFALVAVVFVDVSGTTGSSVAEMAENTLGSMVRGQPLIFIFAAILLAGLGAPLFVVLSAVGLIGHYAMENLPVANFLANSYGGFRMSPVFLAIPLFTLAGFLLAEGKTAERLVGLFRGFLGWLPGGVAIVALIACAFFTAFTGASGVTIIALGGPLLPILLAEKYPEKFSLGLLTTGGSTGLVFPPSIPVFLIAMVMGLSWDAATGTGDFGEAVKPRQEAVQICQVKSEAAKAKLKYEAVHVQADRAMEDEADRKLEAKLAAARGEKVPGPDAPAPKPAAPKDEFELGDDPVIEAPAGDGAAADKPAEAAAPAAPKDEFELGDDEVIEVQADKKPGEAAAEPVVAAAADAAPAEPAAGRDEFELGDDPVIEGDKPAQAAVAKEVAVAADGDPKVAQNDQAPVAEDLPPPVYEDKESLPVPSSSQIFMAGVFPGMLMILAIALFAIITGFRRKVLRTKFTLPNAWAGLVGARYVVPIPFIIAVGIFGGFFTAAEAASATAVYTIIMQMGLYRDFGFKAFRRALVESVVLVGGILIIVVAAMGLLNFLVFASVPDMILGFIENVMPENLPVFGLFTIPRQITFLLLLNVFLLIVGCLMDVFSAILVVLPILLPVAYRFGIHPAHLAVIFIANLEIGYSSPPAGINLFVASLRFNRPVLKMYAASIAFLALMFASLLVITYWPALSLWLVEFTGVQ